MARPVLEYTRIDTWTMATGPGSVSVPLTGPAGTKPLVTAMISGAQGAARLEQVRFTRTGSPPIMGLGGGRASIGSSFVELWWAYNVPVGGTPTTNLTWDWYGTCSGGTCPFGGVEFGYWDAAYVDGLLTSSSGVPQPGGGFPPPGYPFAPEDFTADDTVYGLMMGPPGSPVWTLAGGPTMTTIYPNHATVPPEFTNSQTVAVGGPAQTGAPKVCCGFVAEATAPLPFAFNFATNSVWQMYLLKVTGTATTPPVEPGTGLIPPQFVTILG